MEFNQIKQKLIHTGYRLEKTEQGYLFIYNNDNNKSFTCSCNIQNIIPTGYNELFIPNQSIEFIELASTVDWENGLRIFFDEKKYITEKIFFPTLENNDDYTFVSTTVKTYQAEELEKQKINDYALLDMDSKHKCLKNLKKGESCYLNFGFKTDVKLIEETNLLRVTVERETRDTDLGQMAMLSENFYEYFPSSISDIISFYIQIDDMSIFEWKIHSKLQDRWISIYQKEYEKLEMCITRSLKENIDPYLDKIPHMLESLESRSDLCKTTPNDIILKVKA